MELFLIKGNIQSDLSTVTKICNCAELIVGETQKDLNFRNFTTIATTNIKLLLGVTICRIDCMK